MFGIFRTVLAAMVYLNHVIGADAVGQFSVYSFFCLSGFLMTLLMDTTYRSRPFAFAVNRFLRLYPMYWACGIGMAYMIVSLHLDGMREGTGLVGFPRDWWPLLKQTVLWVRPHDSLILVPTAWALTNEIVYYALIGIGISATPVRSLIWLGVSIVIVIAAFVHGGTDTSFYYSIASVSLPFSLGACLYHFTAKKNADWVFNARWLPPVTTGAVLLLMFCAASFWHGQIFAHGTYAIIMAMLASAILISLLYRLEASRQLRKADYWIGSLSYPIYLCHFWAIGMARSTPPFELSGFRYQMLTALYTLAISCALVLIIDVPIQKIRERIRRAQKIVSGSVQEAKVSV